METSIAKTNSNSRGMLFVAIGSFLACLALVCYVIQFSNLKVLEALADFATHHYFVAGFILLLISLFFFKAYNSYMERTSETYRSKRLTRVTRRNTLLLNLKKRIRINHVVAESEYVKTYKLSGLKFTTKEVLESKTDQQKRRDDLEKARALGDSYKRKVVICFKDNESPKHTLGTVWLVDDENVSLMGGATIPINRIYKVVI